MSWIEEKDKFEKSADISQIFKDQQYDTIIKNVNSRHEKNYWICMKRLSHLRVNHSN